MAFSCSQDYFFQTQEKRMSAFPQHHSWATSPSLHGQSRLRQIKMASVLQQGVTPQHTPLCSSTNIHVTNSISRLLSATTLTLPTPQSLFALQPQTPLAMGWYHLYISILNNMGRVKSSQDHFLLTLINCVLVAYKDVASWQEINHRNISFPFFLSWNCRSRFWGQPLRNVEVSLSGFC